MSLALTPNSLERGVALGLSCLKIDKEAVLSQLPAAMAAGIERACDALASHAEGDAADVRTRWRDQLCPAFPPGLDRVHPGWIRAALSGEPSYILNVIAENAPAPVAAVIADLMADLMPEGRDDDRAAPARLSDADAADLRWALLGHLSDDVALPLDPSGQVLANTLNALTGEDLLHYLRNRGAEEIGLSLAGAETRVVARAMTAVGAPWAAAIARGARNDVVPTRRTIAQVAVASASDLEVDDAIERLTAIGARLVHDGLALEGSFAWVRILAVRLPPRVGQWLQRVCK